MPALAQSSIIKSKSPSVSFEHIARELKVSEATVRNWVLTGNLDIVSPKNVSTESYEVFKTTVVGKEKLHKRANKLHVDETDLSSVSEKIKAKIDLVYKGDASITEYDLSSFYEQSLGDSHKNHEGIFYTPESIILKMFERLPPDVMDCIKFCDPCCGTGNFLIAALKVGVKPENLYGFDTDENAVNIAKARIYQQTGFVSPNIELADFLELVDKNRPLEFDVVFTNPPWGKKYNPDAKELYASRFNGGVKVDSSAIFTLACLKITKSGGYVGALLPDAFFNVQAYSSVRKKLLEYEIVTLIDHQKPFLGLQTRAQSIVLKKTEPSCDHIISCEYEKNSINRVQQSFRSSPHAIYNFHIPENEVEILDYLFKIPHDTLEGNATWGLGIVTGNNSKYITNANQDGYVPVFKGADILKGGFKEPTNFLIDDFSNFQQVAPLHLYKSPEKIVYRFINTDLVFSYDDQQRYFLNSANFFILKKGFGVSHEQITFLLNTELLNWIFKNVFRTHKILRSDLEKLPIYTGFFNDCNEPTEMALLDYLGVERNNGTYRLKK